MNSKTTLMKTYYYNTAEKMYNNVNEFLNLNGIKWSKCVGISTDRARAMSGKLTGFITRARANNSLIKWHHCFIHRVALAQGWPTFL